MGGSEDAACRIDVWLWRARFFKTRGLAGRFVCDGRVRRVRDGSALRLDKPSRMVRPGDALVFAVGGRVVAVQITGLGDRRGPGCEARALYIDVAHEEHESAGFKRESTTRA